MMYDLGASQEANIYIYYSHLDQDAKPIDVSLRSPCAVNSGLTLIQPTRSIISYQYHILPMPAQQSWNDLDQSDDLNLTRISWHCAKKGIQLGSAIGCLISPIIIWKSKNWSFSRIAKAQVITILTGVSISEAMFMSKYNGWENKSQCLQDRAYRIHMNARQTRVDQITLICFVSALLPTFLATRSLIMGLGAASPAVVGGMIYHLATCPSNPDQISIECLFLFSTAVLIFHYHNIDHMHFFPDFQLDCWNKFMFHQIERENSQQKAVLNRRDLSWLKQQEKQFAEQQFRLIYAQEMSKLSVGMSHRRKVEQNLHSLDRQSSRQMKQQQLKLKTKMASIEQKRNQKLSEKTKYYKQNDERWFQKLKEIQQRFKEQKRSAFIKAKQYQEETQIYWKNNKKKTIINSRVNLNLSRRQGDQVHQSLVENRLNYSRFYDPSRENAGQAFNRSVKTAHESQQLDYQIQLHREKSENIRKKKQQYVFQKTLQKLAKIDTKRKERQTKMQAKQAKPTAPKRTSNLNKEINQRHNDRNHSLNPEPAPQMKQILNSSQDKMIKDHFLIKNRIQKQQFVQRGEMLQNSNQRARKQKIVKMIRKKVDELKTVAIRKENSLMHLHQ